MAYLRPLIRKNQTARLIYMRQKYILEILWFHVNITAIRL